MARHDGRGRRHGDGAAEVKVLDRLTNIRNIFIDNQTTPVTVWSATSTAPPS